MSACTAPQAGDADAPVAGDLVERYNARVARIERVRAHAVVEARWTDADGKEHWEQGDGLFVYRAPDRFAMTIGRLGDVYYWLGCDPERFWWFDLNPSDAAPDTAYVGRHDQVHRHNDPSQLLVPPLELIQLLAVTALPPEASQALAQPVKGGGEAVTFRFPVKFVGRLAVQEVRVGAISALPQEVFFIEPDGRIVAHAKLSGYRNLPVRGSPLGPPFPTRISVTLPGRSVELKVNLENLTSEPESIPDQLFNFDAIVKDRKPDRVEDLDAP